MSKFDQYPTPVNCSDHYELNQAIQITSSASKVFSQ